MSWEQYGLRLLKKKKKKREEEEEEQEQHQAQELVTKLVHFV